ncbi:MAG TPA: type II toxin-antitoxin system RelE/ParE family toxin, partial [Flavobacteriaceae bacterium]|nr:type II toxin-antitoxin system RelE/ParE family toxin [Flavobacteriaceae bacterium]
MTTYKISIETKKDLEKIWAYTFDTWSIEQANRYISQIFEEIEYISIKPANGKDFSY